MSALASRLPAEAVLRMLTTSEADTAASAEPAQPANPEGRARAGPATAAPADGLLAKVPGPFSCQHLGSSAPPTTVAAITCAASDPSAPQVLDYYQYAERTAMLTALADLAGDLPLHGDCDRTGGVDTYSIGQVRRGWIACWNQGGASMLAWTTDDFAVLALARDIRLTPGQLREWFLSADAGPG